MMNGPACRVFRRTAIRAGDKLLAMRRDQRQVYILAIGRKDRNRLIIGGEEYES